MAELTPPTVTAADLARWYQLQKDLARIKSEEALLRSLVFKAFFPVPAEGTNSVPLNDGTGAVIKAQHVINRAVDVGSFDALRAAQTAAIEAEKTDGVIANAPKLPFDKLVKWKPEVAITEYRKLTAEEQLYFDQCLVIKPGSPQLEIVIPKRATSK